MTTSCIFVPPPSLVKNHVYCGVICYLIDAPLMVTESTEVYAWKGQMRTFNCTSEGVPIADITWMKRREHLRSNGTYVIDGRRGTSVLKVKTHEISESFCGSLGPQSPNGCDVSKRAIIDVNSVVSGRNYDIFTSIIAHLLTSRPIVDLSRRLSRITSNRIRMNATEITYGKSKY